MDSSWAQGPGTLTADFLATWFWVGQRGFLGLNCPNMCSWFTKLSMMHPALLQKRWLP